ncbi:hypothetical protein [Nakamurella lactea]|uniref:hypothetical protein n=1 Tax=Nakamurella lactea TaxID=459515 RepID=UPI00048F120C
MPVVRPAVVEPITAADLPSVADFLHVNLNSRVDAAAWASALQPPWHAEQPNHGYLLRTPDEVVGVYLALYSERVMAGRAERFCNLAAWCVLEDYRSQGLRLLRSLLGQRGYHFTDLSPSGNVVALNLRLKFQQLDTATALVPNLPWPLWPARARIVTDRRAIAQTLRGGDLEIYRDHLTAAAAQHLVVRRNDDYCYLIFRKDRRKNLPLFASILYVSNRELFRETASLVYRHFLLRHRLPATLAELRVVGAAPKLSVALKKPRPKMFRSQTLQPDQIDYLYSELTSVAW